MSGTTPDRESDLAAVVNLNEPLRRRVYDYVVAAHDWVGRDRAAAELDLARSVAAFHLDRLAEAGLVEVEFRRPPGRSGPGAGRPAKLYRRAQGEITVSVPERHYELAGRLLAQGIVRAEAEQSSPREAACQVAEEYGQQVGRECARSRNPRGARALEAIAEVLGRHGYEPQVTDNSVTLANCPFHVVAEDQRDLVCAMNLRLIDGVVEGMNAKGVAAHLLPSPGRCCVQVDRTRR